MGGEVIAGGQIPDFVWKAILELAKSLIWPLILAFAIIGIVVFVIMVKMGKIPGFSKKKSEDFGPDRRRHSDAIIERLLEQNNENMNRFIDVHKQTAGNIQGMMNAIYALVGEVNSVSKKQDSMATQHHQNMRDLHGRLDILVSKQGT